MNIKFRQLISWITFVMIFISLWLVFMYVPTEKSMGIVQRIFYFHMASNMNSFLAFGVVFVYSILYLWKRDRKYDIIASASAEAGVLFATLGLVTGSIWAKPVWNTWWTWDPRLTSFLILWLIFIAYLMLRTYAEGEEWGARYSAVFGIVGFLDVPIVYMSIRWWRTIHPKPVIMGGEGSGLEPSMRFTLYFCILSFICLYSWLLSERISIEKMQDEIKSLKQNLSW